MQESITQIQQTQRAIIVAEGLSKHFTLNGHTIRAVDNVSLQLPSRQLIAITGPSGCGKSTLLYLIGCLEKPTSGKVSIDGVTVNTLQGQAENLFRRTKVGFVFQAFHLIPNLSALENVLLPMEMVGKITAKEQHRAHELLTLVGIDAAHQRHRPGKLSGGQQQRVAIARALANNPAVLLADEPTGNLDRETGRRIVELLQQLVEQGHTVVVVTHDEQIAEQANILIRLEDGQVVTQHNLQPVQD